MAEKNETAVIRILDMSEDGNGIGRMESSGAKTIFVKDTAPGDLAEVMIIKEKKTYAFGRLLRILEPSDFRVTPVCPVAKACGGCTLQHIDYTEQLRLKEKRVADCLTRIGGIPAERLYGEKCVDRIMQPVLGMEIPFAFRNKMQFPVGRGKDGRVKIGFYAGRTHSIIDTEDCAIGHPVNRYVLKELREWITREEKRIGNFVYDETSHKGRIRHIVTRTGFFTGEFMVALVVNGKTLHSNSREDARLRKELVEGLERAVTAYADDASRGAAGKVASPELRSGVRESEPEIALWGGKISLTSVILNINEEKTNRILGDRCETIFGKDYIEDTIGGNRFRISLLSFFQVNPCQTQRLYAKALEFAGLTGKEVVWDMYCGAGTISLSLAQNASRVFGVEIVPEAVENAKENAALNGIENAEFFAGKAEDVVPALYEENAEKYRADVVVVDPPRKGCDASLLRTIAEMNPERIVYVSCDPATLARDIRILSESGYVLRKAAPVDMFPQTMHIEVCCLLERL